jgi:RNA polymerase sigma factor (sigma-70 family)
MVLPADESFESVLGAARAGAEWAWAEIYREQSPAVLGYLRARRAADPEDLLGEVFLQVVRDLPRFDGGESAFRAWVFTIAHHRLLDAGRSARRRPRIQPGVQVEEHHGGIGDSEEEALTSIAEQELTAMLARLSPDQQSVLLLRILGDLTVEQVASVIGKRPNAVKALQRRGLAVLQRDLEAGRNPLTPSGA